MFGSSCFETGGNHFITKYIKLTSDIKIGIMIFHEARGFRSGRLLRKKILQNDPHDEKVPEHVKIWMLFYITSSGFMGVALLVWRPPSLPPTRLTHVLVKAENVKPKRARAEEILSEVLIGLIRVWLAQSHISHIPYTFTSHVISCACHIRAHHITFMAVGLFSFGC